MMRDPIKTWETLQDTIEAGLAHDLALAAHPPVKRNPGKANRARSAYERGAQEGAHARRPIVCPDVATARAVIDDGAIVLGPYGEAWVWRAEPEHFAPLSDPDDMDDMRTQNPTRPRPTMDQMAGPCGPLLVIVRGAVRSVWAATMEEGDES